MKDKVDRIAFSAYHLTFDYSRIAQLVEQRTVNPFVAGSSPARGAIHLKGLRKQALFLRLLKVATEWQQYKFFLKLITKIFREF